ncbi:unnamed protein product [Euphydryas editha]|uniref:Uncharacterized protein n=1 Tax=Euphydryas editha TaxID=104508 RepID=A0AAU9USZ6_EUPED|nr:unnamed protein product [Euphydryas editha]
MGFLAVKVQRLWNNIVNELMERQLIDELQAKRLTSRYTVAPRIYDLRKSHKNICVEKSAKLTIKVFVAKLFAKWKHWHRIHDRLIKNHHNLLNKEFKVPNIGEDQQIPRKNRFQSQDYLKCNKNVFSLHLPPEVLEVDVYYKWGLDGGGGA